MRRFQALTLIAGLCIGAAAQAQVSEFMHTPAMGTNDITVHGGYALGTAHETRGGVEFENDINGVRELGVGWMYGYGEVWSFGGDIAYSNLDTDNGKSDGLEPIRLFGAGRRQLGSGTIFYGLRAQFAVLNAKLDVNGTASESNRTYGDILSNIGEGGFELAPWIGWQMPAGPGVFGARVSYEVVNTDTDVKLRGVVGGVNSTVDVTGSIKGGSEGQAAVFYEFNVGDMPLGAALTYDFYSKIEQDFENAGIIASDIGARSLIGVNLYTRLDFGGFGFIPSLVWREKVSSGNDIDKLSDVRLNLAGRFSF